MTSLSALAVLLAAPLLSTVAPSPTRSPIAERLDLPIACAPGVDCLVQNYVDHDPGPGWKDYHCGSMSYDGHNGVDFRIRDLAAMRAGVLVLAAAPGKVVAIRDGVPDISIRTPGAPSVKGRECGNGVMIEHADGLQTQYCHMRQGSVAVKPGQAVQRHQTLGLVGLSGDTEFPHLHLTVRSRGAVVDPFAAGAPAGSCDGGSSLWTAAATHALVYRSPAILNGGFVTTPVTMAAVEAGLTGVDRIDAATPMLTAFVRAIGLQAGDVYSLVLTAPNGDRIAQNRPSPLAGPKAQALVFMQVKRPDRGWAHGRYTASYEVSRGGRTVLQRQWRVSS